MDAHTPSFDNMLAAWNERDLSKLTAKLHAALSPDIVFIDPTIVTRGIPEFEKNVQEFRGKYPLADIRRSSGIDSHHNLHRYGWEISVLSKVILVGFDVTETGPDGKVIRVLGFFGPLPKLAA